MNMNKKRKV